MSESRPFAIEAGSKAGSRRNPCPARALPFQAPAAQLVFTIGTAALSFHVRPRMSHDFDFLFIDDTEIPTAVPGYSRISRVRLRHNRTGVEVTVVTPDAIQVPIEVADWTAGHG
jgi:hypothetical protein